MKEINLPSGAILKIGNIPFEEAMTLNEALIEELKNVSFNSSKEMGELYKDLFCIGFSSKKIKASLWECFKRCIYSSPLGDLKIDKDTFQPEESRQDYAQVCLEVAKHVMLPFVKAHSAMFFQVLGILQNSQELKSNPANPS